MTRFSSCSSILVVLVMVALIFHEVSCKELVLTKEWQTVGENETLPAGAHIRMDLTTGEKMAKLLDEAGDSLAERGVEVTPDGTALLAVPQTGGKESDMADSMQQKIKDARAKYDYDMMYRTLSKLPIEEQERMGLPQLPSSTDGTSVSKEQREAFQEEMKQVWERRQEELSRLQLEMQMDMPELLKDRILRLRAYLEDPSKHLMELEKKVDDGEQGNGDGIVTDIESVLVDLEYHLADLDMTRDFHTLGGWHILVSLLDDSVHQSNTNYTNFESVARVQMLAAWAIGTAVKNTEEFYSYAIENVVVKGRTTTPLRLLEDLLQTSQDSAARQKVVYALGSMLRGNRLAQTYFLKIDGPKSISQILKNVLQSGEDIGLAKRILALAGDVISDIVLHADGYQNIVDAFSTTQLCQSVLQSLKHISLRETAVRAIQSMTTFCDWKKEEAVEALKVVKRSWQIEPDIHPEVRRELLDLMSNTLALVMGTT